MLRTAGRRVAAAMWVLGALVAAGCGDDSGNLTPNQSPLEAEKAADGSGDNQNGIVGQQLTSPLRITVTRDDEPAAGVEVSWITQSGGSFSPSTSVTDDDGVAQSAWTLGSSPGQQNAAARLVGTDATPVSFTAFAVEAGPPPPPGPVEP